MTLRNPGLQAAAADPTGIACPSQQNSSRHVLKKTRTRPFEKKRLRNWVRSSSKIGAAAFALALSQFATRGAFGDAPKPQALRRQA